MTLVALASAGVEIPTVAPTIGVMLGLGAGIDYALFLVARHRERLAAGDDVETAAANANGTTGVAVLTAGAIVVVAISGLLAVGIPFVGRMGLAAGVVVAATAVAAVTVMPALLGMAGRRVLGRRERRATAPLPPAGPGRAERWARGVARRPVLAAVAGTAILLALAAPVLGLRLGQPDDGTKPASATQRVAYDRLAEGFGAGFNAPLVVAVALPQDQAAAGEALQRLEAGAKAAPGRRHRHGAGHQPRPRRRDGHRDPAHGAAGRGHVGARRSPARRGRPGRDARHRRARRTSAARPRRSTTWPAA